MNGQCQRSATNYVDVQERKILGGTHESNPRRENFDDW